MSGRCVAQWRAVGALEFAAASAHRWGHDFLPKLDVVDDDASCTNSLIDGLDEGGTRIRESRRQPMFAIVSLGPEGMVDL